MADSLDATARRPGAAVAARGSRAPARALAARLLAAALGLLCAAAGLTLALQYPVGPPLAAAAVFAAVAVDAAL